MPEPITLTFYSRPGCCLCDELEAAIAPGLARLGKTRGVTVIKHSIDGDESLEALYGERVPVLVCAGDVLLEGRPTAAEIAAALAGLSG
jgi:hypothetical protein